MMVSQYTVGFSNKALGLSLGSPNDYFMAEALAHQPAPMTEGVVVFSNAADRDAWVAADPDYRIAVGGTFDAWPMAGLENK